MNFDDRLRSLGVNATNRVKEQWNAEVKLGGPILRNKLWFFATHGRFQADEYVLGVFRSVDAHALRQSQHESQKKGEHETFGQRRFERSRQDRAGRAAPNRRHQPREPETKSPHGRRFPHL